MSQWQGRNGGSNAALHKAKFKTAMV